MRVNCLLAFLTLFGRLGRSDGLSACSDSTTCPTGGIWSEWASSSSGECPTSCGSCSKLLQSRKCMSTQIGCSCTGDTTRQFPCNTQICGYPAQRTCCIPYVSMKVNGSNICGPLEKTQTPIACCKTGGFWTEWSGYGTADDGTWIRTRTCLHENEDCPCVGSAVENIGSTCPCPALEDLQDSANFDTGTAPGPASRAFVVNTTYCTAKVLFNSANTASYTFCKAINGLTRVQLRIKTVNNTYQTLNPAPCSTAVGTSTYRQDFTCDLQTLNWRYDNSNLPILGIGQITYS